MNCILHNNNLYREFFLHLQEYGKGLCSSKTSNKLAIDGVSLNMFDSEIFVLLGHNGGKFEMAASPENLTEHEIKNMTYVFTSCPNVLLQLVIQTQHSHNRVRS